MFEKFKQQFPEMLWLSSAIFGFLASIHATYYHGLVRDTYIFYIIVPVSAIMYFFRRQLRRSKS
jgi:hypothetical protein